MKKFPVSLDDIVEAVSHTDKDTLAVAIAEDTLGNDKRDTEQFGRHVMAYKNLPHESLVAQVTKMVLQNSASISESTGCFLDKGRHTPLNFEHALIVKLENLVGELDSTISRVNPAASIQTARGIVKDWGEAKIGTPLKHDLSDSNLSLEYRVGSVQVAITPRSELSDQRLMEAAPILNELSAGLKTLSERKLGRSIPEQGLRM